MKNFEFSYKSKINSLKKGNLDNYFNFHICLFVRSFVCLWYVCSCVWKSALILAVLSQNITNKCCLVCFNSGKYAFCVNLIPLVVQELRQNWAMYIDTHFSVSSPTQCWSKAVVCISTPRIYLQSGYFLVIHVL